MTALKFKIFALVISCVACGSLYCQYVNVSGTVYDITKKTPFENVSVLSTSGKGTATDSLGKYSITVKETDSIYFSFLNRATPKYAITTIANLEAFDIAILRKIQQLPAVFIKQRSYKLDSLQNREDYAKVFNFRKPGIRPSLNPSAGGVSVGLDLDEFINMFSFRKNKRMLSFQKRLIEEEEQKFISHRFNKGLVKKLTGLQSPALDSFMVEFRPTADMVEQFNDLELGQFIVEAYKYYKEGIKINRSALRRIGY